MQGSLQDSKTSTPERNQSQRPSVSWEEQVLELGTEQVLALAASADGLHGPLKFHIFLMEKQKIMKDWPFDSTKPGAWRVRSPCTNLHGHGDAHMAFQGGACPQTSSTPGTL